MKLAALAILITAATAATATRVDNQDAILSNNDWENFAISDRIPAEKTDRKLPPTAGDIHDWSKKPPLYPRPRKVPGAPVGTQLTGDPLVLPPPIRVRNNRTPPLAEEAVMPVRPRALRPGDAKWALRAKLDDAFLTDETVHAGRSDWRDAIDAAFPAEGIKQPRPVRPGRANWRDALDEPNADELRLFKRRVRTPKRIKENVETLRKEAREYGEIFRGAARETKRARQRRRHHRGE